MNMIIIIARIVETVVLAPIVFIILYGIGDRYFLALCELLFCLFGAELIRCRILSRLHNGKKMDADGNH